MLTGTRITGRSQPIATGTSTRMDCTNLTGCVTLSRAFNSGKLRAKDSGTGMTPTYLNRPAATNPPRRRVESPITPINHTITVQGTHGVKSLVAKSSSLDDRGVSESAADGAGTAATAMGRSLRRMVAMPAGGSVNSEDGPVGVGASTGAGTAALGVTQ